MDPDDFRAQMEEEIAAAPPVTRATAVDPSADAATRAASILALGDQLSDDDNLFNEQLQRLANTAEDPAVRNAVLTAVQTQSFQTGRFEQHAAAWNAALRGLTSDPDMGIRLRALSILSNDKDAAAQQLLVSAVNDPANGVVPVEMALALLSNDVHAEVYDAARTIAANPPNDDARFEALRVLSADAGSVETFVSLLRNTSESSEVRRLALAALNTLSPESLVQNAQELVLNGDADPDVVASSLVALAHTDQPLSADLSNRVAELMNSGGDQVQLAAVQLRERLDVA